MAQSKARQPEALRRCHISGKEDTADNMLRFVHAPDAADGTRGVLTPDLAQRLPGQDDVWLVNSHALVIQLAALPEVNAPRDLAVRVENLMRQNLAALISLARKAGVLVNGFTKTEAALKAGSIKLLFAAHDGAEGGRSKLAQKARVMNIALCSQLSGDELGMALGRENVIHAGLTDVGWADRIDRESRRLAAYKGDIDGRMSE